ncbi:DNA translocase FtsK [Hoeflea sp. YIM 152468]|uniref:FtsK/SpoIIIE family DNA translocase n=1 Tax=Hoeflea sp. YIM 152468 TaxID=3031759 RepID=UPI0023DB9747|nr:DNA translocase FtsK [Hoeflea sp. YIM 152468]MDF1608235.1 DNA translocase FtsK [Hoeflea sp. YIM 152468]
MGDLVRRQIRFVIGLVMLAGLALAIAALATWNVADPSFSNANGAIPHNALGFPGAAFADLVMQFFGLAGVIGLVPVLFWAIGLLRNHPADRLSRRGAAWFGGAWLTAALFGLMPSSQNWPLPNGIGGVLGDMALKIPSLFTGDFPSGLVAVILGLLLAPPAGWLLAFGAGLIGRNLPVTRPETAVSEDDFDADDASRGSLALGAVTHAWFTLRGRMRRLTGLAGSHARQAMPDSPLDLHGADDRAAGSGFAAPRRSGNERIEPGFAAAGQARTIQVDDAPPFDIDDEPLPAGVLSNDFDDEDPAADWRPQAAPVRANSPGPRIAAPAERPKPGARVQRDAQGSMLQEQGFSLPSVHLLNETPHVVKDSSLSPQELEQNARMLEGVLEDFGVKGEIIHVRPGPVVTLYELEPAPGIKSSRVIGLADDIARSMSAIAARVAVVPGRNAIGIELPNQKRETVYLRELIASRDFETSKAKLGLALGKTIGGEPVIVDLAKMPHVLVAGTTGSGKSVAINTMILSILYRMDPSKCRLIMIDPKMLELSVYDGIPHLLTPVVTDPKKAVVALKWTVREMEQRYKNMSKIGVRNIDGFNSRVEQARASGEPITRTVQTGFDRHTGEAVYETEEFDLTPLPYIVVLIDEMADLMMVAGKDIEGAVQRLAQMARAAGIHVIMATQRPSVDVITGTIKANFPTRMSFQVTSKIDSRTILGEQGAEQLLGMGDMLYMAGGGRIQRVHGPFVSDKEVEDIVSFLKTQGVPEYLDSITEDDEESEGGGPAGSSNLAESDDPYDQAVAVVLRDGKASTSYIQRRLGIGYNRAASLIERMEQEGVISAANHAGKREILVPTEDDIDPQ